MMNPYQTGVRQDLVTRDFFREADVQNRLQGLSESGLPGITRPESFLEDMGNASQVSQNFYQTQLDGADLYTRVYESQVPVIRELVNLADAQSSLVKSRFLFDHCEWTKAAYNLLGERLRIMHETLPLQDIHRFRPSLPDELSVLLGQLQDYHQHAALFQEFLHFLTNPASIPPFL